MSYQTAKTEYKEALNHAYNMECCGNPYCVQKFSVETGCAKAGALLHASSKKIALDRVAHAELCASTEKI